MNMINKVFSAEQLDNKDPLAKKVGAFSLPNDTIYLDGNSLGPLPKSAEARASEVVKQQWGQGLITSWNKHQWISLPQHVGDKIGYLIGARSGQVICCDSISINLFKLIRILISLCFP